MKLLLKIIAGLIALIIVVVIALVLFFDPNVFKPRIEAMAKEQGIALDIAGDLGWTFWPSLGVEVNEIRVAATSAPDKPIAQLHQASLLLAIMPLLSGEVIVHHVLVDGAMINLNVNEQGTGNWEALTAPTTTDEADTDAPTAVIETSTATRAPGEEAQSDSGEKMQLAIEKISLLNSSLTYRDAQSDQDISLENIQLGIEKFNLQGQPFDMRLSLLTRIGNSAEAGDGLAIDTSLHHQMQLAEDFSAVKVEEGEVNVVVKANKTSGEVRGRYSLLTDNLQDAPIFEGEIDVDSFNARKILAALDVAVATKENYALSDIALKTTFKGTAESIVFDPLHIRLDKTTINGSVAVTDFATSAIKVVLNGDRINLDDYLTPTDEAAAAHEQEASGDEELIPLETIKTLNADISVDFAQVAVADMSLKNIALRTTAKDGLVKISKAQATVYDGIISATGSLDGRGDTAIIKFNSEVKSFQLGPFFNDMELTDKINLSGGINATAAANARGVTVNQLMDTLVGEAVFSGAQVRLSPLNIEQQFCRLINLVNRVDASQKDWESFTEMKDLSGKVTVANHIITVETFTAGVEQLMLSVTGVVDLANDTYDVNLPIKLIPTDTADSATTSTQGCVIGDNYWLNRSLSLLRCHGALETLDPVKDCRPDAKALTSLTKDFAKFKLREKHGDKIDAAEKKLDEEKDELRKKLDDKLGVPTEGKKPRDLLKGYLNKKIEQKVAPVPAPEPSPQPTPEPTLEQQPTEPAPVE